MTDKAELMRMDPRDAYEFLSWEAIEFLFAPRDAFELMLRKNYDGTLANIRANDKPIVKDPLWEDMKHAIASEDYFRHLKTERDNAEKRMNKKIRINLKDPDGVYDSIESAGYDMNDLPSKVDDVLRKFIEYKEYLSVEIDIETGEARVLKV